MKTIRPDVSREQVIWLLAHALFVAALNVSVIRRAGILREFAYEPIRLTDIVGLSGRSLTIAVGIPIFIVAMIRLLRPFQQRRIQKLKMTNLVLGELILIAITGGMVMDCGETGILMLHAAVAANLFMLGFLKL